MTGIHTSNTGVSSSTEGTTNDWDTYVKHRSILECRGYNQWLSSNTGASSSKEGTTNDCRQTQEHLRVQRVQPMTGIHTSNTGVSSSTEGTTNDWDTYVKHRSIFEYRGYNQWLSSNTGASSNTEGTTNDWDTYVKHRSIFEYRGYNQWLGYIRQTQEYLRVQRVQPMTGIHTSNTGASSSTEGTTNDWDTYVKHRSIFEYRGYNQWLGYIRQTQEHLRVQRVQPMTGIHTSNTGASSSTEGTTNDWDTYVKHRSIFEYRGYNQWLGYIRQTQEHLRVQRVQPMTGIHTSNTGASSSTEGTTNDWDTYVKHRSIFEYRGYNQWLGYIRQTQEHLRVQRVQPMTGIHTSNTGVSSSTEGTTNDWDTYVKHRSILECRGYNQWLGYIRQTQEHLRVQRVQPMTVVKHMSIFEYRGYNQWLGYIRQTQEHRRVQRVQPMTVVKHRSIFECRGYNQWLGYILQTQEHLRVQRVQPMTGIHTSNTGASYSAEGTTNDCRQTQEHLRV